MYVEIGSRTRISISLHQLIFCMHMFGFSEGFDTAEADSGVKSGKKTSFIGELACRNAYTVVIWHVCHHAVQYHG